MRQEIVTFYSKITSDIRSKRTKLTAVLAKQKRSELLRNSVRLLSANVVAQAIGLLVYPILTRIYAPENFGLLNLFLNIGNVLVLLANAEYHNAVVLPKEECEAHALVHACLCQIGFVTIIAAIIALFSRPIATVFHTPELAHWLWLLPFFVAIFSTWNVVNYWFIRQKAYRNIQQYQISQSITAAGIKTGLGYAHFTTGGLILSTILAPFISLSTIIAIAWKKHVKPLFTNSKTNWSTCKQVLLTYKNFPLFTLPRNVVNLLAAQMPVWLLTPIFGTKEVGFWSMAMLLGFAPINMISRAMYQTFYENTASKVKACQPIGPFFRKFTFSTLAIIVPSFFILYFLLPTLTQLLLGDGWETTGEYLRWMLPWFAISLLTATTCFLSDIFFKQKIGLYTEILLAIGRCGGVLIGVWLNSFAIANAGYCIGSSVVILGQYIWLMSLARKYDRSLMQ